MACDSLCILGHKLSWGLLKSEFFVKKIVYVIFCGKADLFGCCKIPVKKLINMQQAISFGE